MDYFIKHGTGFSVEVGSIEEPEITRWTSWGHGDLQQSFLLHTAEGTLMIDPVLPEFSPGLQAIKQRAGKVAGIVSLSSLHERNIAEAAKRYRAPVYGPASAKKTTKYGGKIDRRYKKLEGLDLDLIINGHNTLPLVAPQEAVRAVLQKGTFAVHPSGVCTFIYMDFK